jgi:hypothetical protein
LGDYPDAKNQYQECIYLEANKLLAENKQAEASALFMKIQGYKDSTELFQSITYSAAKSFEEKGELNAAADLYSSLGDYKDAKQQAAQSYTVSYESALDEAKSAMKRKDYKSAVDSLETIDKNSPVYKESEIKELYQEAVYLLADSLFDEGKPYEAYPYYKKIEDYKDVKSKKLDRYAYKVLGKWEAPKALLWSSALTALAL